MKILASLALSLALSLPLAAVTAAHAAQPSIYVSMKVEQDGNAIAQPSLLVESAQQARLRVGDRLEVELVANDLADRADLSLKLYAKSGDSVKLVGNSRILANYGQEAVVAWGDSGSTWRIAVKPVLAKAQ